MNTKQRTSAPSVTGTSVTLTLTVPVAIARLWDAIVDLDRIGRWSPETIGATWFDGAEGPMPGAQFLGRNRFPNGTITTSTCVVTEAERPYTFGFSVLDGDGVPGSLWHWDLQSAQDGGTTVRQTFTHGPGVTGARVEAAADPASFSRRLGQLCQNMGATLAAMTDDLL